MTRIAAVTSLYNYYFPVNVLHSSYITFNIIQGEFFKKAPLFKYIQK